MVMGLAPARYDSLGQALSVRVAHRESVRLARPRLFPYGLAHQAGDALQRNSEVRLSDDRELPRI